MPEAAERWAIEEGNFLGTMKQLTCCAKCGKALSGGYHKPRKVFDMFKPTIHFLCDDCFETLPE